MVNPNDPGFRQRARSAELEALNRAADVRTDADYHNVLTGYLASFNDPHLSVELSDMQNAPAVSPPATPGPRGNFEPLSPGVSRLTLPTFYAGEPGFDAE